MKTALVTVDASRMSLDLEVPAEVPVSQLLPSLVGFFSQHGDALQKIAWDSMALLRGDQTPLKPEQTLLNAGIVDGARLILRDASWVSPKSGLQPPAAPVAPPASDDNLGGIGIRWNTDGLFTDR